MARGINGTDIFADDADRRYFLEQSAASEAKKQCAFLCCRVLGYSHEDVAGLLNISSPAVSWLMKKGQETMRKRHVHKFINLTPG